MQQLLGSAESVPEKTGSHTRNLSSDPHVAVIELLLSLIFTSCLQPQDTITTIHHLLAVVMNFKIVGKATVFLFSSPIDHIVKLDF